MNKSLALKNKLYLFFLLLISLFIFFYLFYFLVNGERGIIAYYKIKNTNFEYNKSLLELENKNLLLSDRINRLKTNSLDLDYLDEIIRKKTGFVDEDELLVIFEE